MTQTVSIDEAKDRLQDLLTLASEGNEVIITDESKPLARLVPIVSPKNKKRTPGLNRGNIWTTDDFDEPLPDEFWNRQE